MSSVVNINVFNSFKELVVSHGGYRYTWGVKSVNLTKERLTFPKIKSTRKSKPFKIESKVNLVDTGKSLPHLNLDLLLAFYIGYLKNNTTRTLSFESLSAATPIWARCDCGGDHNIPYTKTLTINIKNKTLHCDLYNSGIWYKDAHRTLESWCRLNGYRLITE